MITLLVKEVYDDKPTVSPILTPVVRKNSNLGTGATSFHRAVPAQANGACPLAQPHKANVTFFLGRIEFMVICRHQRELHSFCQG